ncbi:hypothetical protein GCM10023191_039410 [Actinoallomurus oryzae]|uniref:Uncharacterized protein n=1 Tax=Actinoallomurus oryzae TaxID=502180 RepID=A0ABP8Q611_9ACTN
MSAEDDAKPPETCALPGCERPVEPTEDGSVRRYCSRTHRVQARRLRRLAGEMGRPAAKVLGELQADAVTDTGDEQDAPGLADPPVQGAAGDAPAAETDDAALMSETSVESPDDAPAVPPTPGDDSRTRADAPAVGRPENADADPPAEVSGEQGAPVATAGDRRKRVAWTAGAVAVAAAAAAVLLSLDHHHAAPPNAAPGPRVTATVTAGPSQVTVSPVGKTSPDHGGSGRDRPKSHGGDTAGPDAPGSGGTASRKDAPVRALSAVRYGFENGRQGWSVFYGDDSLSAGVASDPAYQGTHALRLAVKGSDYGATGVDHPPGVHGGTVVTYRVWTDGRSPGSATPFVQDAGYHNHFVSGAAVSLSAHRGWREITWTVPGVSVLAIGLQVGQSKKGAVLALDGITW